jgi:membrane-bound ClpP family serine protease
MLLYAILLLILGLFLIVLEVLIPSGGLLGLFATAALIASVVFGYMESTTVGVVMLVCMIILVPVTLSTGFRILPHTRIGRQLINIPAVETAEQRGKAGVSERSFETLVGKTGRAVSDLRPSGAIEIHGETFSAVSDGSMIEADAEVVVRRIDGNSIVVEEKTGFM